MTDYDRIAAKARALKRAEQRAEGLDDEELTEAIESAASAASDFCNLVDDVESRIDDLDAEEEEDEADDDDEDEDEEDSDAA